MDRKKLQLWIERIGLFVCAFINTLLPFLNKTEQAHISPDVILAVNFIASAGLCMALRADSIAKSIMYVKNEVAELRCMNNAIYTQSLSMRSGVDHPLNGTAPTPRYEIEEEPQDVEIIENNEPITQSVARSTRVPMNAYYNPDTKTYDITPRFQATKI